ncbi:unnamed protein product [Allacma fusca]|uniref:Uncharacterized protein n=1 Tax=Allacma fusca TaxID=39272 RepID=A0A8J2LCY8_9HEXA|nr:unnamed protein product [Allacma fusca]
MAQGCLKKSNCFQCVSSGYKWVTLLNRTQCCSPDSSTLDALFVFVEDNEAHCPTESTASTFGYILGFGMFGVLMAVGLIWSVIHLRRWISMYGNSAEEISMIDVTEMQDELDFSNGVELEGAEFGDIEL